MLSLQNQHAVIFGVASEDSIAWSMAKKLHAAGARISLGYQPRFKSRVFNLVRSAGVPVEFHDRCDVTDLEQVSACFEDVRAPLDVLVHPIAYANPETFGMPISEVSQTDFAQALVNLTGQTLFVDAGYSSLALATL